MKWTGGTLCSSSYSTRGMFFLYVLCISILQLISGLRV